MLTVAEDLMVSPLSFVFDGPLVLHELDRSYG